MPAKELSQCAVNFILVDIILDCQTAVIGTTDEVRPALDSAENLVVDINQTLSEHHEGIQPGVDRIQHFTVNLDLAGPLPEGLGGEVGGFLRDKLIELHGDHLIGEPLFASLRNYKLNCFVLGKLLKDCQAGDVGTGQLNGTQRLAVVQPAEELSDLRFCHSFIVINREVVVFNPVPCPLRQLREVKSTDIIHTPVVIYNSRGVGGQCKFIMEKFADGI